MVCQLKCGHPRASVVLTLGWPGPAADLCFPVSAEGLSGSVAVEPCLGHLVIQLLKLRIPERFGNIGRPDHPAQDCISFAGQPILRKPGIAFHAVQAQSSLFTGWIRDCNRQIHFIVRRDALANGSRLENRRQKKINPAERFRIGLCNWAPGKSHAKSANNYCLDSSVLWHRASLRCSRRACDLSREPRAAVNRVATHTRNDSTGPA